MTSNRWLILAVLFFARLTMAAQFQSMASLSPFVIDQFAVGLADIGFLIGLYFAPGLIIALPGGAVAARFGDKRVVAGGLFLMLAGGAMVAAADSWNLMVAGRLIAGIGGVVLNVVMTKMVVDWFAGREIATAMAVFINSWPVGIALGLVLMPVLATAGGLAFAGWVLSGLIAAGLLVFAVIYQPPVTAGAAPVISATALPLLPVVLAGGVWAFYNAALAMVFSFGSLFLADNGRTLAEAGSVISLFMVIFAVAGPFGGVLADKSGRKTTIILTSLVVFAALMPVAVWQPQWAFAVFCVLAVVYALAAGPIMSLPAEVLSPPSRAFGMGIFFTIYYLIMMIAPRIGGGMAEVSGSPASAILLGAALSGIAAAMLVGFRLVARS